VSAVPSRSRFDLASSAEEAKPHGVSATTSESLCGTVDDDARLSAVPVAVGREWLHLLGAFCVAR